MTVRDDVVIVVAALLERERYGVLCPETMAALQKIAKKWDGGAER